MSPRDPEGAPPPGGASHPLEESGRLAWQATAAVGLLERFGDLLTVALEAVGSGDDHALDAALMERERLVAQLEPLLASLAAARELAARAPAAASRAALGVILRPVDDALRNAQHLHLRLADEVRSRAESAPPSRGHAAPLALVP